jgi:hypothetical protein
VARRSARGRPRGFVVIVARHPAKQSYPHKLLLHPQQRVRRASRAHPKPLIIADSGIAINRFASIHLKFVPYLQNEGACHLASPQFQCFNLALVSLCRFRRLCRPTYTELPEEVAQFVCSVFNLFSCRRAAGVSSSGVIVQQNWMV